MKFLKNQPIAFAIVCLVTVFIYFNYTKTIEPNPKINRESQYYVNDLYMSDQRIYNNYLNNKEQKMYNFMFNHIKMKTPSVKINLDYFECANYGECTSLMYKAHTAILVDHPELLSYASYRWRYDENGLTLSFEYVVRLEAIEQVETYRIARIIDKIKQKTKKMTDKEKIIYVYEWIGTNNTYDRLFTYTAKNQSIYNVFLKKNAVCAGFAKASQVIFQNIGINSYGVLGHTTGPHMWNMVELDGKYYNFDSTVAASYTDPKNPSFYLGLNQEYLKKSSYDSPNYYPELSYNEVFGK